MFEINGNTIQKTVDGNTIPLGEFLIDEDNRLSVNGNPIGLVISSERQSLSYTTNPEYHFTKYENVSLDPKYSYLIGSWTDGSNVISISEKDIIVKQGDYVVDKGIFFVKDGYIRAYWEKGYFQDGLVVEGEDLVYEGGGGILIKLPEQTSTIENTTDIVSAFTLSSKPYDGDIKWIYGLWKLPDSKAEIYITPKYFQARGANDSYLDAKEITEIEKVPYVVKEEENKLLGTIIKIGDYYLDVSSKLLYSLSGLDKRTYLEKTENYVSPLIKYGKWGLLGLIGITALVFLLILIIRLLKKGIFALKQWHLKTKEKLAIKLQEAKKRAVELRGIVKEKAIDVSSRAKDIGEQTQKSAQMMAKNIKETGEAEGLDMSKIKKWGSIFLIGIVLIMIPRWCGSSDGDYKDSGTEFASSSTHPKKYVGTWSSGRKDEPSSWIFELEANGSAHIKMATFEYNTSWTKEKEDNYAVIGGTGVTRAFLLYPNGKVESVDRDGLFHDYKIRLKKK